MNDKVAALGREGALVDKSVLREQQMEILKKAYEDGWQRGFWRGYNDKWDKDSCTEDWNEWSTYLKEEDQK